LIAGGLTLGTPILLAALGGMFSYNARIFNIGLEGFMLVAAYFSVLATGHFGSPWLGVLAGLLAGLILAAGMGFAVLSWGADEVIIGIALNLLALGVTSYLLTSGSNTGSGFLILNRGLPTVNLGPNVAILNGLLQGHDPVVPGSWLLAILCGVAIQRSRFGYRVRASGESELSSRAAGVNVWRTKMWTFLLSGMLSGIGGAELALGSVHLFSQDMTAGAGIIAFAAVVFGGGRPLRVVVGALLFGFAESLAGVLQLGSVAPEFVLMMPYVAAIVALTAIGFRLRRQRAALTGRGLIQ
jgi:simple sugar transport system permease protein